MHGSLTRWLWSGAYALVALVNGGCLVSTDFGESSFLCTEQPICPDGYSCVDGRCVQGTAPDGGGGGGGGADAAVPPSSFSHRRRVTFDNQGRGQLDGFPALVTLSPDTFDYGAARADGADLAFFD